MSPRKGFDITRSANAQEKPRQNTTFLEERDIARVACKLPYQSSPCIRTGLHPEAVLNSSHLPAAVLRTLERLGPEPDIRHQHSGKSSDQVSVHPASLSDAHYMAWRCAALGPLGVSHRARAMVQPCSAYLHANECKPSCAGADATSCGTLESVHTHKKGISVLQVSGGFAVTADSQKYMCAWEIGPAYGTLTQAWKFSMHVPHHNGAHCQCAAIAIDGATCLSGWSHGGLAIVDTITGKVRL